MAKLLDQPCPQCGMVDELRVVSKLTARRSGDAERFKLLVLWRPVLVCEACDLYVVGTYTPDGNHALFDSHGGGDGPVESEVTQVPAE